MRSTFSTFILAVFCPITAFAANSYVDALNSLDRKADKTELFQTLFKFEPFQRLPDKHASDDVDSTLRWLQQEAGRDTSDARYGYAYSAWLAKSGDEHQASIVLLRARITARADALRCADQTAPGDHLASYEVAIGGTIDTYLKSDDDKSVGEIYKMVADNLGPQISKRGPDTWICNGGLAYIQKALAKNGGTGPSIVPTPSDQLGTVVTIRDDSIKPDFIAEDLWQKRQVPLVNDAIDTLNTYHGWGSPPVTNSIIRTYAFEITAHVSIEGKALTIERVSACDYYKHTDTTMGPKFATYGWKSELNGAVASVLPDKSAFVIELPNLCAPGSPVVLANDDFSPLIDLPNVYQPVVLWFPDATDISRFELYPSIGLKNHPNHHVQVNSVEVHHIDGTVSIAAPTSLEEGLAGRFGVASPNEPASQITRFDAHSAYVIPKALWAKNKVLNDYFGSATKLMYLDDLHDPTVRRVMSQFWWLVTSLNRSEMGNVPFDGQIDGHDTWSNPPLRGAWDEQSAEYYEVPTTEDKVGLVLSPDERGIRTYRAVSLRSNSDEALAYKGVTIVKGILYDPETQMLVAQIPLQILYR